MKGSQLRRFCYKSKANFKHNAPTVLTWLGAIGVVTTAVLSATATSKVLRDLEAAKDEKGDDLTTSEVVRVAAPSYIPTTLSGLTTLACIFGADVLNRRRQAALMSAYLMLDNAYTEYKNRVKEKLGEDVDAQIQEEMSQTTLPDCETVLFYDMHLGEYFESSVELVKMEGGMECYIVNTSSIF